MTCASRDGSGASPRQATHEVRRQMKDRVRRRLPLTRLEHDAPQGYRSGTTYRRAASVHCTRPNL